MRRKNAIGTAWIGIFLLVGLCLGTGSLRAATKDIKNIDIIVKKQPTGTATQYVSDDAGRVRLEIAEAGTYTIEAVAKALAGGLARAGAIRMRGNFANRGAGDAGERRVAGKWVDGNALLASGVEQAGGGGGVLFSTTVTVTGPVSFTGQLTADAEVRLAARHVVFYGVENGPQPPAQRVTIVNNSTAAASYTASFAAAGARWALNAGPPSGSIAAGDVQELELRPGAGMGLGAYHGFLKVRMVTAEGTFEQAAAVTLYVQAAASSRAKILVDRESAVAFPLPEGGYEAATYTFTNNGAATENYATRTEEGVTAEPSAFVLRPGESRTVTMRASASFGPRWIRKYIWVRGADGFERRVCLYYAASVSLTGACRAASLQPVVTRMNPPLARAGFPLDVAVQVFDDCGEPVTDFTAVLSVNNGRGESAITTVQATGKAITKAGSNGGFFTRDLLPSPGIEAAGTANERRVVADVAPELALEGYLYPYFHVGAEGLRVKVDVEAENPAGGDALYGSVETELAFEAETGGPLVAQGAFVANSNFEPAPVAPFEFISLFTLLPGRATAVAGGTPWPVELGGVQVLLDGEATMPLLRVAGDRAQGILPELTPGRHIVNVVHGGTMGGAMEFEVAEVNPSPLFPNVATRTPYIFDTAGQLITRENPMRAGQVYVMFANGLGKMKNIQQRPGDPTPSTVMEAEKACRLTFGRNVAELLYCGRSPGSIVLDQVNFRLREIAAEGVSAGETTAMEVVLDQEGHSGTHLALGWGEVSQAASTVDISVQANYADARFLVNNQPVTGSTGLLTFPAGQAIPLDAPADPQTPGAGTRYYFHGWSQGGARQQTVTPQTSTAYGVYFLASYLLTVNGTAVVKPPGSFNNGNPSADGFYTQTPSAFIPVMVTGSCAGGAAATGLLVSSAAGSAVLPNGSTITMNRPTSVTVQCPPPTALTACTAPPAGMVGWFPLDESSGTVAGNLAATAWPGVIAGTTSPSAGRVVGARNFSGGGFVEVVDPNAYDFKTGDFSVDAWILGTAGLGSGTKTILEKHAANGSQPFSGYRFALREGRLSLHIHDQTGTIVEESGGPILASGRWYHVAATVNRTKRTGILFVNGSPVRQFSILPSFGSLSNSGSFRIGGSRVSPSWGFGGLIDEVEVFDREVPEADIQRIFAAGAFGKCRSVTQPVSHVVTLAGCGLTATAAVNATTTTPLSYPAGTLVVLGAHPAAGETFASIKVTMGGVTANYTTNPAQITLTGNAVVTSDCGCVEPPRKTNLVTWFPLNEKSSPVTDIAGTRTPAAYVGSPAPSNGKIGGGGISITGVSWLDAADAAEGDIGSGDFSIDLWLKTSVAVGTQTFLDKRVNRNVPLTRGYSFYLLNGRLSFQMADGGGTVSNSICGTGADASCTNFEAPTSSVNVADGQWHLVAVTVSRTGGAAGGKLWVDGNVVHTFNPAVRPGSLSNATPLRIGNHGNAGGGLSGFTGELDEVEIFSAELTASDVLALYAAERSGKCEAASPDVTVNVKTAVNGTVTNAGLQIGVDGATYTDSRSYSAAGGSQHIHATQSQVANGFYYTFTGWAPGTAAGTQTVTLPASGKADYVANFDRTGFVVTLNNPANCSVTIGPVNLYSIPPPPIVMPFGVPFFVLPGTGNPTGFSVSVAGGPALSFSQIPAQVGPFTGPVTITPACGAAPAVTLTVATNPAGLDGRIGAGGAYSATPIAQQVPPNQVQTISVLDPQMRNGTGFRFTGWSTGGSTATTTVQPASNFTATANFQTACHTLTVIAQPAGGGTVTRNPATGVAGFPADCYAPGTPVTLTANPAAGFAFSAWTGASGASAAVTVTVNAPVTVTANFAQAPVISFAFLSRANGNLSLAVRNTGGSPATNVRVLSIGNITANGATFVHNTSFGVPPYVVPGAAVLAVGASSGFNVLFEATSGPASTPFSFTITANADNVPAFSQTINVP